MKPLVGLGADFKDATDHGEQRSQLYSRYHDAVSRVGGLPVAVLSTEDESDAAEMVSRVDALVLTGGADLDPALLGLASHPAVTVVHPRRARFELALARAALDADVPLLAICLGMQVLNVAVGGTLFVHMTAEVGELTRHQRPKPDVVLHDVHLVPGSQIHRVYGSDTIQVYSNHHQAVDRLGPGWQVTGESPDQVVEAIEPTHRDGFCIGVQWHPENPNCPDGDRLFAALVEAARRRARDG